MKVVTAAEMREIDNATINEYGIPGMVLMENAGIKVTETVRYELNGELRGKVIVVFVAKGNNGGDGLVIARHLLNQGADVRLMLLENSDKIKGDAAVNLGIWNKMGKDIYRIYQPNGVNVVKVALLNADLIVDAIYGTGFKGKVNEKVGRIIQLINDSKLPVISVDIPSGLEADTGKVPNICVKAKVTVTFGLPKVGLTLERGPEVIGRLEVADISIPRSLLEDKKLKKHLVDSDMIRQWLPKRKLDTHKGDFGRVLVVAGSKTMPGAALLTAKTCLKAGAGLVTLAVPSQVHSMVSAKVPEVMVHPLPDVDGVISEDAVEYILDKINNVDIIAIGPGLSQDNQAKSFVCKLVEEINVPMVIDADGINALADHLEILKDFSVPVVITPHPGEMARLLGVSIAEVQQNRLGIALRYAKRWGVTLLLKGLRTLVANPEGMLYINSTGNPGMATAGSGDILTGIVAGFMAQGLKSHHAAAAAAYLHGMAGDIAKMDMGENSLMAGDILTHLPLAMRKVLGY